MTVWSVVRKVSKSSILITKISKFLDDTKGHRKVDIASYFPDYELFIASSSAAMRNLSILKYAETVSTKEATKYSQN